MKNIIVIVVILISTAIFTFIGMWIAPYAVGLFQSNIIYNIILGVISSLLAITFIVLLCKKRLRIYSLILLPHIIALSFVMLYVGNNIVYMIDGFIKVKSPFSGESKIKTISGRVVFDGARDIGINRSSGKTFFVDDIYSLEKVYDRDGNCILTKPSDDERVSIVKDAICTEKHISEDEYKTCRIRIFSLSGEYLATRLYESDHFFWVDDSNPYSEGKEYLKEYIEEVVELEDGVKIFTQDSKSSEDIKELSAPISQPREPLQTGRWEYKECPTCHGYGEHIMVECKRCRNGWLEPGFGPRDNGKPESPRSICNVCNGNALVVCPNSHIKLKKYVYD